MSSTPATPGSREEVFCAFFLELDESADKQTVVEKYAAAHPCWAEDFRREAALDQVLDQAPAIAAEPGPPSLPDFRIVRELARGGMGVVYEAEQLSLGRQVAVKVRHGWLSHGAQARFLREQRMLAQLHQTHIVPIHTAGQHGPWQYFAMAYIEGAALHHVVQAARRRASASRQDRMPTLAELAGEVLRERDGDGKGPDSIWKPLPDTGRIILSRSYLRSVAGVMADTAEALQHAHQVRILHRDVKPSNIMVETSGRCWLIDFGLARVGKRLNGTPGAVDTDGLAFDPDRTQGPLGTPEYMAPEQYQGQPDEPAADIWGLGVSLYELLALRRAYEARNRAEVRAKVLAEEPPPLDGLVRNIPADLAAICRKAMHKQPARRFATAAAFADDLRRWLREEPTTARPAHLPRRLYLWARRNKGWATALGSALMALLLLAGGGVFVARVKEEAAEARTEQANHEREAARRESQIQHREALLQKLIALRLKERVAGWSDQAWAMAREAAAISRDEVVRDQAAATLLGLDARVGKTLHNCRASGILFDPTGQKLLLGGTRDSSARPEESAHIWDPASGQLINSELPGDGPIAFRNDGTPLQLVPKDLWTFQLWDVARRRSLRTFHVVAPGEPESLSAFNYPVMALAADGSLVAASTRVAADQWKLRVWRVESGQVVRDFPTKATALLFAPDGSWLAAGMNDGRIVVWSLPAGQMLAELLSRRAEIHCLAYRSDYLRREEREAAPEKPLSGLLAAGDAGAVVTVWDLATRQVRSRCLGSAHDVFHVAFSPDGATLASGGRYDARLWDIATGHLFLTLPTQSFVESLAFSGNGRQLVLATRHHEPNTGRVDVWHLENGRGMQSLGGLTGQVVKVLFSFQGDLLAGLTMDWHVGIWHVPDGRLLHVLEVPRGLSADNAGVAFSPDGGRFAFSAGSEAKLWELDSGRVLRTWPLPPGLCDTLAFTDRGQLFLIRAETRDRRLPPFSNVDHLKHPRVCRVRDLFGRDPLRPRCEQAEFNRHIYAITSPADGRFYIVEGRTGVGRACQHLLTAFDGQTGHVVWSLPPDPYSTALTNGSGLDPLGKHLLLLSPTEDGIPLRLLRMPAGELVDSWEHIVSVLGPEACYSAIGLSRGIGLFHGSNPTPLVRLGLDLDPTFTSPRFNAAGTHLAWGSADGTLALCDLTSLGKRLEPFGWGW